MPQFIIEPKSSSLLGIPGVAERPLSGGALRFLREALLERVIVDAGQSSWVLFLMLEDEAPEEVRTEAAAAIKDCVPGVAEVAFRIRYSGNRMPLERRLSLCWKDCVQRLIERIPGVQAWIADRWSFQDGLVAVEVPGELGIKWLTNRHAETALGDMLGEMAGAPVRVEFVTGDFHEEEQQIAKQVIEEAQSQEPPVREARPAAGGSAIILGRKFSGEATPLHDIIEEERQVVVAGEVFALETRELKSGRRLISMDITDETDSISVKIFDDEKNPVAGKIAVGDYLYMRGPVKNDNFLNELVFMPADIMKGQKEGRHDNSEEKRVELHFHTKMSAMDALVDPAVAVKTAAAWGHPAVAITDHGVVQAFPEAYEAGKKAGIKVIFGLEGYLVEGQAPIVTGSADGPLAEQTFVVFDLETTGLSSRNDEIIEIGAVKVRSGEIIEQFSTFVDPGRPISPETTRITGITGDMVAGAPAPVDALAQFEVFAGECVLVAHNAEFDMGFLKAKTAIYLKQKDNHSYLDTLALARTIWPDLKNHKLDTIAGELQINLGQHHRASDDANTAAQILNKGLKTAAEERGVGRLSLLNSLNQERAYEFQKPYHIILLVKNQTGMQNLYRMVSASHLQFFHRQPRLPRHLIEQYREGLIIGSACESGELFQAIVEGREDDRLEAMAGFYDYLEIQPLGNNQFMLASGQASSIEELKQFNRRIIELGRRLGKPVVATCDVHFLNPQDEVYRRIIMAGQGFEDADRQAPLYFRTTSEMLAEFEYLSEEDRHWVVLECPNEVAGMIEKVRPVPDEFFPPKIEGADDEIRRMAYERAIQLYGDPLPKMVADRIEWELKSIVGHGYAVLYLIAQKLVKKSLDDGYLVGSRGSVGSSLVATMCNITEVNPLPAHYLCTNCKYSEFMETGSIGSGVDLPDKNCPKCGKPFKKEGHDIPFATFMGFEGDKEPDIDLNFSGEYQGKVHKYTEELFGKDYVFRAGTITTLADKTAFGFVRNYLQEHGVTARRAEMNRLVKGCTGVRRSTGQHPGGMMVVPPDKDIHDFTPVQYPANDKNAGWVTTHFDYHSLSGRLVKLDILGHDDPTVIRMLQDLTGIDPHSVPLDDPETMRIFSSVEPLGITPEEAGTSLGTLAIPEFGTPFVRQMLEETTPTTFSELIMISGLSHGTGVWVGNAQDMVRAGQAKLSNVIAARDDIMNYLLFKGAKPKSAFKIMESVRKGRGVSPEDEATMREVGVPDWYIASCRKIQYLFPKAHATAYVMMSFRIAYFKVHYPEAFYATYFTVRASEFDADMVAQGPGFLREELKRVQAKGKEVTAKEEGTVTAIEVVLEAMARGIRFLRVDIYHSNATHFLITPEGLLPPLASLPGVGENAALQLSEAVREGPFTSVEELKARARLSSAVIEALRKHGCLKGLPETDQLTLFAV